MLVGFIGAPCSGKTTTAAKLFAALKENGQPCEYIAEKARAYIAEKRFALKAQGRGHEFRLFDGDQLAIAKSQFRAEMIMDDPGIITVTDSCVLNSFLYMSPGFRSTKEVVDLMDAALGNYDLLFVCGPVPRPSGTDPNRVHDADASALINDQIYSLLVPMVSSHHARPLTKGLSGDAKLRLSNAFSATLERFYSKQ